MTTAGGVVEAGVAVPASPSALLTTVCATELTLVATAAVAAAMVCVTGPLSPGLPMRMETFVFSG
jgi:hypothetical protein